VKYLLGTHIALWATYQSRRLSARARELLSAEGVETFVSAVSLWDIALKNAIQPGDLPPVRQAIAGFARTGYRELAVTGPATIVFEGLPMLHRDPFDRMLVSQASADGMVLLTGDAKIGQVDRDQRHIWIV
jgi:PIN domain nuclease of toxin-antitoxin system